MLEPLLLPNKIQFMRGDRPHEGVLVVEPCAQGYGTTLGNALRRVLLSSLSGAAVIAVRIKGVDHEFSTASHVKEDILEIILNLKLLRAKVFSDEPVKLSLSVKAALDDYNFTYEGKVYYLKDLGIIILKVDFTDFKDELSDDQRAQLLAGVFGREQGRGISLRGQGVAEGQQKQLAAVEGAGKLAPEVIKADALVRASGAGILNAAVAAFIQKQQ